VNRYQKGKTNLDFTEARDSEWQRHQLGHMQVCISLQTDNHASTPPLSFLQAGCPSCRPTNSVKALKANPAYQRNIIRTREALTRGHTDHFAADVIYLRKYRIPVYFFPFATFCFPSFTVTLIQPIKFIKGFFFSDLNVDSDLRIL